MKNLIASLTLLVAVPVVADDYIAIVEQAFASISSDFHQEWAFTETTSEDGITIVGRYDPRLRDDARWRLLTIDGRKPNADEVVDYQDQNEDRFQGHGHDNEIDFVALDTIELIEESDEYWVFSFTPEMEDDEDEDARKFMQEVNGTLKVIRDGKYIEYIDMRNDKPIRPAFSAKITQFLTHLTFGPAGGDGPIVPISVDVEVNGRALLVIKIDVNESIRYEDYEYVGS